MKIQVSISYLKPNCYDTISADKCNISLLSIFHSSKFARKVTACFDENWTDLSLDILLTQHNYQTFVSYLYKV